MVIDLARAAREAASKVAKKPSVVAQHEVSRIKRILQPDASRDVTGPAATIVRRIDGRLSKALVVIRRLEVLLKVASNPAQIASELRSAIDQLFYNVAMDWLDLRLQMNQPIGTLARLQGRLPSWFRKLVDLAQSRGGVPAAGGGLRPFNLKNTTGDRRDPHFKGEVVPHHALPEKQREGLRPDGLEWLYSF